MLSRENEISSRMTIDAVPKYVIDQLEWLQRLSGHIYQARDTSFYILNRGKTDVNVLQFLDSFVMLFLYLIVNDELVYARFR